MRLLAALLPPEDVRADLAAVTAAVPGSKDQLTPVPAHLLHLRLANFGKVALSDAVSVSSTLQKAVAKSPPMRLRFRGGTALEPIGDDSAWAKLEGDVEQLAEVAGVTAHVAKRLGFLVDRRLSRTLVRVGRITPATTETYLQRLIDHLEAYTGPEWTCRELALLRITDTANDGTQKIEVLDPLPLSAAGTV